MEVLQVFKSGKQRTATQSDKYHCWYFLKWTLKRGSETNRTDGLELFGILALSPLTQHVRRGLVKKIICVSERSIHLLFLLMPCQTRHQATTGD